MDIIINLKRLQTFRIYHVAFVKKKLLEIFFLKGKKEKLPNLNKDHLLSHADALNCLAAKSWMKHSRYSTLKQDIKNFAKSLLQYCSYLDEKNREIVDNHRSLNPVRSLGLQKGITISVLEKTLHGMKKTILSMID